MNSTLPRTCSPAFSGRSGGLLLEVPTRPRQWSDCLVEARAGKPPRTGEETDYNVLGTMPPDITSYPGHDLSPPRSSMEAYLLLEAARSERVISRMREDLAHEIVHRNVLALQLNRLVLDNARKDSRAADELVGSVRFSIRRSGLSVAHVEQALQEPQSSSCHGAKGTFGAQ